MFRFLETNESILRLRYLSSFIFNIFGECSEEHDKKHILTCGLYSFDGGTYTGDNRKMILIKDLEAQEVCKSNDKSKIKTVKISSHSRRRVNNPVKLLQVCDSPQKTVTGKINLWVTV